MRGFVGAVAVTVMLVLPGAAQAQDAPLAEAAAPVMTVTPTTDLVDHQVVTATGSGFASHRFVSVLQCKAGATDFDEGCMFPAAVGAFTDGRGRFSESFGVSALMPVYQQPRFDCRAAPGACELQAVTGAGAVVVVPLQFDPAAPAAPPPTLTVSPNTGLVDGQILDIDGSGLRPRTFLWVFVCEGEIPSARRCPQVVFSSERARLDGTIAIRWRARAVPVDLDGEVDCRRDHCFLATSEAPWEDDTPMVPLEFDPDAPLLPDPSINVAPTSNLQDGQEVSVVGTGGFAGGVAFLQQCLVGRDSFLDCNHAEIGYGLGAAGGFSGTMTVRTQITTLDDRVLDCRVERCEVVAEFSDVLAGYVQEAGVEITFGTASTPPLPAAPTAIEPRFAG